MKLDIFRFFGDINYSKPYADARTVILRTFLCPSIYASGAGFSEAAPTMANMPQLSGTREGRASHMDVLTVAAFLYPQKQTIWRCSMNTQLIAPFSLSTILIDNEANRLSKTA